MKFIRIIKASNEWWKKYYEVTKPSIESKEEFNTVNEEGRYNLTLIADLEAKAKYSDELGNNALDYGWLVEEKGNIYPVMSVGDRIIPIDLSEVKNCCKEFDLDQLIEDAEYVAEFDDDFIFELAEELNLDYTKYDTIEKLIHANPEKAEKFIRNYIG